MQTPDYLYSVYKKMETLNIYDIRSFTVEKTFRPLRRLKILGNRHNYLGKPCSKSVFHCSRVFVFGAMQNNKESLFRCELHHY